MKIGDIYIHTITNTRLRVKEIVDERKGDFTAYLRPEDPECRSAGVCTGIWRITDATPFR